MHAAFCLQFCPTSNVLLHGGTMQTLKINLGLFFAIFLWASAFVGIRIGLTSYSPGSLALFRFLIASACMALIYSRQSSCQKIPWVDRLQLGLLGVAGIGVYNTCLNYGEQTVSAGIASFVIGLMPALTILLSVLFLRERPKLQVYFGLLVSLSGLVIMMMAGGHGAMISYGVLMIFIAALTGSVYTLLQKPYLRHYHPVAVTAWIIWGGTLSMMVFFPALWREIAVAKPAATWAVVYLGIFPAALAYLAWSYVLKALSASNASMYLYAMPVISSVLGFIMLHEQPSVLSLCGGMLTMIGAFYASRSR